MPTNVFPHYHTNWGWCLKRWGRQVVAEIKDRMEARGLHYDGTVSLGHILTILTLVGGMLTAYVTYHVTISNHEMRLKLLEVQITNQSGLTQELTNYMWAVKQDIAVIRDRVERNTAK